MNKNSQQKRSFVSSEEKAKDTILNFLKESGENKSSLAKKIGIDPPSLYNFMSGRTTMTFRTFEKIERYIHEQKGEQ